MRRSTPSGMSGTSRGSSDDEPRSKRTMTYQLDNVLRDIAHHQDALGDVADKMNSIAWGKQPTELERHLRRQHERHMAYIADSTATNQNLADNVRSLQNVLAQERQARAIKREGYQRLQGLTQSQVRHVADL